MTFASLDLSGQPMNSCSFFILCATGESSYSIQVPSVQPIYYDFIFTCHASLSLTDWPTKAWMPIRDYVKILYAILVLSQQDRVANLGVSNLKCCVLHRTGALVM